MIDLTAEIDNQEILRRLKQIQQTAKEVTSNVVTDSDRMDIAMRRFTSTLAKVGAGFSLASLVQQIARTRGEFQQLEVAFTTLLQSKEKADALMSQMVDLAAKTPFDLQGVADGARQLLAYGFAAEDITDTLTRLGNVAAGLGLPLERLTYLYGTTAVQGRLYARDMLQFTSSGIPMLQEMAKMYGVTTEEINAMVTAGKIGFEDVKKVIESMTNQGGQFYNLMENQSKTITGLISNLGDAIDTMFNDIGKSNQGVITNVLQGTISLVENYQKVLDIIIPLVAAYGAYKAALIVVSAAQRANMVVLREAVLQKKLALMYGRQLTAAQAVEAARVTLVAKGWKALTLAIKANTAALLANPVTMVTAAIAGLVYGVYKLVTAETAAERAQRKHNEAMDEFNQRLDDTKNKINERLAIIRDDTQSTIAQMRAYDELKKLAPTLTNNFSLEELKNVDPSETDKSINAQAEAERYQMLVDNVRKWEEELVRLKERYQAIKKESSDDTGLSSDLFYNIQEQNKAKESLALAEADLAEYERIKKEAEEQAKPVEIKLLEAKSNLDQINKAYEEAKQALDKAKAENPLFIPIDIKYRYQYLSGQKDQAERQVNQLQAEATSGGSEKFSDVYAKAAKEWKDAKQELRKIEQDKEAFTKAQYDAAKNREKEARKVYSDLGGDVSDKVGREAIKKQQKLADELERIELDLQSKRIALMREGKNKRLAEIDLEYQQTVAKINKEKQTAISGGATEDQLGKYDSLIDIAGNKRVQDRAQVEKDYAMQTAETYRQLGDVFLSEEERKQRATEQTYQAMRDKAVEYLQAGNISGADFISMNDKIDRAEAKATAQNQLEKWQKYATERLRIEEEFQQDVARIRNQGRGKEGEDEIEQLRTIRDNDIATLTESMGMKEEEFTAIVDNIVNMGLDKILEMIPQVQAAISALGDSDPTKKAELQATENALKTAKSKQSGNTSQDTAPGSKTINEWKDLQSVLNDVYDTFGEVGDAIGGTAGAAIKTGGEIATSMTQLIDGIVRVATGSVTAVQGSSQAASAAIKTVETASVILAIISAALQVATKIASLFTKDHELSEETIKSYEAYIDVLDQIVEREKEVIESHTGMQAVLASDDAVKAIEKQEEATRKLGKAYLASRAKNNHSYGVKTAERLGGYQDAIEAAGFDWSELFGSGRMEGLFDLSGEEIERFQKELPEVWAQLDEDTRKYLETIVDCKDKMDELGEATSEALTGFTLDDARSELEDFLNDMDMTFKDVADNFEDIMMSAINRVITSQLDGRLQTWYENFSKAMEDGVLSETERDALKNEYESIYTDALQKREQAYALAGIDENALNNEQNASSRGFETMSQDTGTELNGRFTAIQEYTAGLLRSVEEMTSIHSEQNNNLIDIRDIMIQLNGNVADIRGYCKVLPNMADSMASMKRILNDKL